MTFTREDLARAQLRLMDEILRNWEILRDAAAARGDEALFVYDMHIANFRLKRAQVARDATTKSGA